MHLGLSSRITRQSLLGLRPDALQASELRTRAFSPILVLTLASATLTRTFTPRDLLVFAAPDFQFVALSSCALHQSCEAMVVDLDY